MADMGPYFPILIAWTLAVYAMGFAFFGFFEDNTAEDINGTAGSQAPDEPSLTDPLGFGFLDDVWSFFTEGFAFLTALWGFVSFAWNIPIAVRVFFLISVWMPWLFFLFGMLIDFVEAGTGV